MNTREEEAVLLTRKLIQIESTNPGAYEGALGEFVFQWLSEAGAEPIRDEIAPGRFNISARLAGEQKGPALVYMAHMDTVPLGDGWSVDPLAATMSKGQIYGRGACDMKAGLACVLLVCKELVQNKEKLKLPFILVLTADEEDRMEGVEQALREKWIPEGSWVLDAEPTDGQLQSGHKGRSWFSVVTKGKAAHGSTPKLGADAIAAMGQVMCEILCTVDTLPVHPLFGNTTAVFLSIEGKAKSNGLPEECTMMMDMRIVPPMTNAESERIVLQAAQKGCGRVPGASVSVEMHEAKPFVELDLKAPMLLQAARAFEEVTGEKAPVSIFPGYTDSGVVAARTGNHNCLSFGPGALDMAHRPDEYVSTQSICKARAVLQKLAENVLMQ